jgi:predicted dehydrogenase
MTSNPYLGAIGAGGRQMREHRIPAMLAAGGRFVAVADPTVDAAERYVRGFTRPSFLRELRERGYDVSDEAAKAFARARVFGHVEDMLDAEAGRMFGVISAVPAAQHAPVSIRAMQAGLHVSCDKPTADSPESALEMLTVAERQRKVLQIGYQWGVQLSEARWEIGNGAIGDLIGGKSRWSRQNGIPNAPHFWNDPATGGVSRDIASHQYAGVLSLTGRVPARVRAWGSRKAGVALYGAHAFKAEDTVGAELEFGDGQVWSVFASWAAGRPPAERAGMTIHGSAEDAWMDVPVIVQKSATYRPDARAFPLVIHRAGATEPMRAAGDAVTYTEAMKAQAIEFLTACESGDALALPPQAAIAVEVIVDATLRSAGECDEQWGPWVEVAA